MTVDDADMRRELGLRVRRAREARNWSRSFLADQAGISRNTVASVEGAHRPPTIATVAALAEALPELKGSKARDPGALTDEDLRVAQAFHDAPTAVRAAVLRALEPTPTEADDDADPDDCAQRLARLDASQAATVLRLIREFERAVPRGRLPGTKREVNGPE